MGESAGPPHKQEEMEASWPIAFDRGRAIFMMILGLFMIALCAALYFARDFFMPVTLAFLLALTLTPIVRFLGRHGIPAAVSALVIVLFSLVLVSMAAWALSGPIISLIQDGPEMGRKLAVRLEEMRTPFTPLLRIAEELERISAAGSPDDTAPTVQVRQPGFMTRAAGDLFSMVALIAITFVLSIFLLSSGTLFYEKLVKSFAHMSAKKRALRIVYDVEREISLYLLTITVINVGLGFVIALGLWVIGIPNALLWGAIAALMNFLPYIGATLTTIVVTGVALVTFDTTSQALLVPAFMICCNMLEGQFITPLLAGRRLELNAVAIFIALAFWSWLWGIVGALIAVPLLVITKVMCDHFEALQPFGHFLSAQAPPDPPETAKEEGQIDEPNEIETDRAKGLMF
ncbi:AI-2E family transporter [Limoniibacter endophyticus]|uniref:AI-2E family transporter n=1 Tax=Limoniibacter endophyticus TaxID=1565040 RepID=A0A8J3DQP7_9HYPH|nr:AI-2E family transporter [Limoniibacter endophyticus]GHC67298.1 AI-2E family transporter [Limoniibacter endophyticus]